MMPMRPYQEEQDRDMLNDELKLLLFDMRGQVAGVIINSK